MVRAVYLGQSHLLFDWLVTRPEVDVLAAFIPAVSPEQADQWFTRCVAAHVSCYLEATPQVIIDRLPPGVDLGLCAHFDPLPSTLLSQFTLGIINVHPAPLPEWSGRYPLIELVKAGAREAGVSLHWMSDRIDQGDLIEVMHFPVAPLDGPRELETKAEHLACHALNQHWDGIINHYAPRTPQKKRFSHIASRKIPSPLSARSGEEMMRLIRAYGPYGGVGLELAGSTIRLMSTSLHLLNQEEAVMARTLRHSLDVDHASPAKRTDIEVMIVLKVHPDHILIIAQVPRPIFSQTEARLSATEEWALSLRKEHLVGPVDDLQQGDWMLGSLDLRLS